MELNPLANAVAAMDRLNSYARTPACHQHIGFKDHLYRMKDRALKAVTLAGAAVSRPVYTIVSCHVCHGTGTWESFNGHYREPCNKCHAHGRYRLYFRETRITQTLFLQVNQLSVPAHWPLPDLVWHSPISEREAGPEPESAGDWKPRTPGREMTLDRMLADLILVEQAWFEPLRNVDNYGLHLGTAPAACGICGGDQELVHVGCRRGRLSWTGIACQPCKEHFWSLRDRYRDWNLLENRLPRPPELETPNLKRWIELVGGKKTVATTEAIDRDGWNGH